MQNNQKAAREARRFLDSHVRSDWSYPDVPPPRSGSDEEIRDVEEFRERYYGSSASDATFLAPLPHANPYKFESPESVGDAVERRRRARRRKLRVRQQEEMAWNEGMKVFIERQEVWTGAATVRRHRARLPHEGAQSTGGPGPPDGSASLDGSQGQHHTGDDTSDESVVSLAPLAPRLLADNPIRTSIRPSVYQDIYANIVVRGRPPSVPVNLSDMTRALVQGWKGAGEWPPKANPIDPLPGGRRKAGVGAAGSSSRGGTGAGKGEGVAGEGQFLSHHPHVKKGVDSVKRMLHLNGLGHHHHHGHQEGGE
ncbi:uncharacterized protein EI97DRAFT_351650, partial [Westerdykella ornata]